MTRPPPQRRLSRLLAVGAALLLLVACGEKRADPRSLDDWMNQLIDPDPTRVEQAVRRLGEMGRANPDRVVPRLVVALERERAEPRVNTLEFRVDYRRSPLAPDGRRDDLSATGARMARRLSVYGYPPGAFTVESLEKGIGRISARMARQPMQSPEEEDVYVETMLLRLSRPADLQLALVVERPDPATKPPSLWEGDAASFDAFVQKEAERLEEDFRQGRPYEPTNPRYRLCHLRPERPDAPPGLVLVLQGEGDEAFGRSAFHVVGGASRTGENILQLQVSPDRQDDLAAWTGAHRGRRVALVVNGRAELLATIGAEVRQRMELTLGRANDPRDRAWIQGILDSLAVQPHTYPVMGKLLPSEPKMPDTPVARALVAVGPAALTHLEALEQQGGSVAIRARWAREQIAKEASRRAP